MKEKEKTVSNDIPLHAFIKHILCTSSGEWIGRVQPYLKDSFTFVLFFSFFQVFIFVQAQWIIHFFC